MNRPIAGALAGWTTIVALAWGLAELRLTRCQYWQFSNTEVARRIANGDRISAIQVRNQQVQRAREVTQEQALSREGRAR